MMRSWQWQGVYDNMSRVTNLEWLRQKAHVSCMWGLVAGAGVVDCVLLAAAACYAVPLLVLQAAKPDAQENHRQDVQHQAATLP